jgi:cell wall-associated NlpC family hydrolase
MLAVFAGVTSALTLAVPVAVLVVVIAVAGGANQPAGATTATCALSDTTKDAPPDSLMPIYRDAASRYGLGDMGWAVLAAVNRIETNFGQNLAVSSAGAVGWMQFRPDTWNSYGVDADNDGKRDPYNPQDAIYAAANYLRASGAPTDWHRAVFAYNPSEAYVQDVLDHASGYVGLCTTWTYPTAQTTGARRAELLPDGTVRLLVAAPEPVVRMVEAANRIANKPYKWGGGHATWEDTGYDCSGYTSYVLHAAGLLQAPLTASGFMAWGQHGVGDWVTVWATTKSEPDHVFMMIAGLRFDSGGQDRHGSAWRAAGDTRSISGFEPRTLPGL